MAKNKRQPTTTGIKDKKSQEEYAPRDPVCGKRVNESDAVKLRYQGEMLYFCCTGCKRTFERLPSVYSARAKIGGRHNVGTGC